MMQLGLGIALTMQQSGGGGDDPPPVIVGNSTTIVSGGVTLTLSAAADYGYDQLGRAFIVAPPGGLTVLSRSPAPTTISTKAVSGTMKNPAFGTQGWDERMTSYTAGLNEAYPISIMPGDVLVCAIHGATPADGREGHIASFDKFYFVEKGWGANAIAPDPVTWPGKPVMRPDYVDCMAIAPTLPAYDISALSKPALADVLAVVQRNEISMSITDGAATNGYEWLFTIGAGGPGQYSYGRNVGLYRGMAGLYLISNSMTVPQKATLLAWMISHGLMFDSREGNSKPIVPNGGHFQFHFIDVALALFYTGRQAKLADMRSIVPGNVLGQPFIYTAGQVAQLAPHSDTSKACIGRRRSVTASSGTSVTVDTYSYGGYLGDPNQFGIAGLELVRESDGKSALITAQSKTNINSGGTDTIVLTINAAPSPAFAASDVVYLRPTFPVSVGDADWRLIDADSAINPCINSTYRSLNFFSEEIVVLRALGIWHPDFGAMEEYVVRANRLNDPTSSVDYPTHNETLNAFPGAFWGAHAASIVGDKPLLLTRPTFTGLPEVGQTLTAVSGVLAGKPTIATTWQWTKDGANLATTPSIVVPNNIGEVIGLIQTATNSDGARQLASIPASPIASAYSINAVQFDGVSNRLNKESGYAGGAGGKTALVSFSFQIPAAWVGVTTSILNLVSSGGNTRASFVLQTSGAMAIDFKNSANAVIATISIPAAALTFGKWYTVISAVNTATPYAATYYREAGGTWVSAGAPATLVTDGLIEAIGRCRVGTSSAAGAQLLPLSYLADIWASTSQTLDLSNPTNRDKFLPSAGKGSDGSAVTGTAPELFLSGATASWETNKGSGSGLTLTGAALTTAPSVPT